MRLHPPVWLAERTPIEDDAVAVHRFRLRVEPAHPVVPLPTLNLRPRPGVALQLTRRDPAADLGPSRRCEAWL